MINGKRKTTIPSPILITKILLGTLGCVPAYDRFFIAGLDKLKIQPKTVTLKGLKALINFYKENMAEFDDLGKKIKIGDRPYPLMKLIDMYFWQVGVDS